MRIPATILIPAILAGCQTLPADVELPAAIQAQVVRELTYVPDIVQYGQSDRWVAEPISKKGDCEDYALTMANRLNQAGVPTSVEVCMIGATQAHAVAVAHTLSGDWVLDNVQPYPIKKNDFWRCTLWLGQSRKPVYLGK